MLCTVLTEQRHPPASQAQPGSDSGQKERDGASLFPPLAPTPGPEGREQVGVDPEEDMDDAGRRGRARGEATGPGEASSVPEAAPV